MLGEVRRFRAGIEPDRLAAPDTYLTDERRLFRVAQRHLTVDDALVELEDCRTLDVWLVPLEELAPLRTVRPGASPARAPAVAIDRPR